MRTLSCRLRPNNLLRYVSNPSRCVALPCYAPQLAPEARFNLVRSWKTRQISHQWSRPYSNNACTVGVNLEEMAKNKLPAHTAYIGLGSNMGDRIAFIEQACNLMAARGIEIKRTSHLWETEPMYLEDQPNFINAVCEVKTSLDPLALLDELLKIENILGRKRSIDKGPRTIDLDVLIYGDQIIDHDRLKVPHPGMFERQFVLEPLCELAPGLALNPREPWKNAQDYSNDLTNLDDVPTPLSTVIPLPSTSQPFHGLRSSRKTKIMGILNMTPDSLAASALPNHSPIKEEMFKEDNILEFVRNRNLHTASIIDIGGQSTAPASAPLSVEEELAHIRPAIIGIKKTFPDIPISVDTYYASVAKEAVALGADLINDVSAGRLDPEMLPTMAELGKTVILMHMRGDPQTMTSKEHTSYPEGLIPTIASELISRVQAAEAAGVRRWRIVLDPGIGFAKNAPQNVEILRNFDELRNWLGLRNFPWLVGSSNKRFVGRYSGLGKGSMPEDRLWGTAATCAAAVHGGADIVRVHDVKEMSQVVKMSDAIWRV